MKRASIRLATGRRFSAVALAAAVASGSLWVRAADAPTGAAANMPTGPQSSMASAVAPAASVADVAELKAQAFHAVRDGNFEQADDLFARAARATNDPVLMHMHDWTDSLQTQLHNFKEQRRKAYEKAIADEQLLLRTGHEDYALDLANRAMLLTDEKASFTNEGWVKTLIDNAITHGEQYQKSEQWLRAMRVYADLAAIQPSTRQWKDDLKDVQRRVRMLVWYAPDALKPVEAAEARERDQVDALLTKNTPAAATAPASASAATQPAALAKAAKATTEPTLELSDALRIDWKQMLHGIQMPMLQSAMHDADINYYRDISYKDLMIGGLDGIRAMLTTHGLEQAFPGLSDPAKKSAMLDHLDQWTRDAQTAAPADCQALLDQLLSDDKTALLGVDNATVQLPEEVVVSEFAGGALGVLDPFSSMIWPSMLDDFNKTTQGEFSGVGISIQPADDGYIQVVTPLEDTPAYRAGIHAGQEIVAINAKSTKGISSDQAVRNITGPTGTTVRLTIRTPEGGPDGGHDKEYTLRREVIKVASVKGYLHKPGGGWDYYVDPENKIAYLRITNFTKSSADELDKAIADMGDAVNGIILDLRGDPGGLLTAAIDVSDKFIDSGVIVSTRADRETPNSPTIATAKPDENQFKKPVVVLVNQLSASASEIVSGALKDDKRALVVGERTFGKGSVQMLFPLTGRAAFLKLTTSHYYLPSGRCLHREENSTTWGVDPDVTVEMTPEQMNDLNKTRGEMDILRDATSPPAAGADEKLKAAAAASEAKKTAAASTQPTPQMLLSVDPQLSAALLLLRLEVAGANL
jgi:carboxyl-terminal processing protease